MSNEHIAPDIRRRVYPVSVEQAIEAIKERLKSTPRPPTNYCAICDKEILEQMWHADGYTVCLRCAVEVSEKPQKSQNDIERDNINAEKDTIRRIQKTADPSPLFYTPKSAKYSTAPDKRIDGSEDREKA